MKSVFVLAVLLFVTAASAQENEDGTYTDGIYDAEVTTNSGTYTVPVEVEDGEVTHVQWPNGGDMSVDGAQLDGGSASGTNSRGETVDIEIQ